MNNQHHRFFLFLMGLLLSLWMSGMNPVMGQQVQWTRVFPFEKEDLIRGIVRDENGNMYACGRTARAVINSTPDLNRQGFLMKIDSNGDSVYTRYFGQYGEIYSLVVDPWNVVRINFVTQSFQSGQNERLVLIQMTESGVVFQQDTIPFRAGFIPWACIMGKDSSLIVVGRVPRTGSAAENSMFFQRVQKDGTVDPWIELNPGHPNCVANRVEQLPNGHYLVSGYVGSRIASYELDEDGGNPVFKQWYQTPNLSNFNAGYVGQAADKRNVIAGQGSPCRIALYDSLQQQLWMKRDTGILIAPQAMADGSLLFGYSQRPVSPTHYFARLSSDSNIIWNLNLRDSLEARGLMGNLYLKAFAFFEDQSAVVAAVINRGSVVPYTNDDPIFLRISNVGTPVTSLSKPRKGPLQNETLAPWPNPSSERLYLKQHFDQAELRLYNLSGQEVARHQIRFGQPADVSQLPPGLYLYRAVIDGKPFSGKVVKADR